MKISLMTGVYIFFFAIKSTEILLNYKLDINPITLYLEYRLTIQSQFNLIPTNLLQAVSL